MSRPPSSLASAVRQRAHGRCEYCQFPELRAALPFEVEHIIPVKHGGETTLDNLAIACFYCNRYKGPNLAGIARPGTTMARLFHPRLDFWPEHFRWAGATILGLTDIGLATISVLRLNQPNAIAVRELLIISDLW